MWQPKLVLKFMSTSRGLAIAATGIGIASRLRATGLLSSLPTGGRYIVLPSRTNRV
jgi:hypothetical protein